MILHLMIFSKTSEQYIKFLKENFNTKSHEFIFWVGKNEHNVQLSKSENIKILKNKKELFYFYSYFFILKKYDKIIVHGWYYPYLSIPVFLNQFLLKKIYWCMWGGDCQILFEKKDRILSKIYYWIDKFCKIRVKAYITHIEEEYKEIVEKFKAKGEYIDSFMYPGNMYKEVEIKKINKKGLHIQIGNSAEERDHLEILNILKNDKDKIEKIYLPLAYGDSDGYVQNLLANIPSELQEKVYPLTKIVPYNEYLEFLNSIDIAIFPFKRQQAFGNIITLLGIGKTVYLNKISLTYDCLKRININIREINKFMEIKILTAAEIADNKKKISSIFSKKNLIRDWKNIFKE